VDARVSLSWPPGKRRTPTSSEPGSRPEFIFRPLSKSIRLLATNLPFGPVPFLRDGTGTTSATAASDKVIYGMTGRDRWARYLTALGASLRRSELRSLTRRSFDLDATPPTETVPAAYSKRRREDTLAHYSHPLA